MNKLVDLKKLVALQDFFASNDDIELALLIGSRAAATARENSDWDFAVQWQKDIPYMDTLGKTEVLKAALARLLDSDEIDIVDMHTARLAMRAVIAEEGIMLKGDDQLPWSHFLLRTWRELEEFYWERHLAA